MTIEETIQKAYNGGYREAKDKAGFVLNGIRNFVLDPLFWQSLGKAMGWGTVEEGWTEPQWTYKWHHFIDHLIKGGTIEEFFNQF